MFRIFLIEDDPVVQAILLETLEAVSSVSVFENAESCQSALNASAQDLLPNLFLLDIGLENLVRAYLDRLINLFGRGDQQQTLLHWLEHRH